MRFAILFLTLLAFAFFSPASISAQENSISQSSGDGSIQELVRDKTPQFIKEAIAKTVAKIEKFRTDTALYLLKKKEETWQKIQAKPEHEEVKEQEPDEQTAFQDPFKEVIENSKESSIYKPLKYLEFYFLASAYALFSHKTLFYVFSGLLVFLLVRALTKQ